MPGKNQFYRRILLVFFGAVIVFVVTALVLRRGSGPGIGLLQNDPARVQEGAGESLSESGRVPLPGISSPEELDDPGREGWSTEVLAGLVKQQLDRLRNVIKGSGVIDTASVHGLVTADFTCESLLPESLSEVFVDQALRIHRARIGETGRKASRGMPHRGPKGLADALAVMVQPWVDGGDVHCAFKLFRIEDFDDTFTTRQYVTVSGPQSGGMLEQNATWTVHWQTPPDGGLPRMLSIAVEDFETAESLLDSGTLFSDCTESVLGANPVFHGQLLFGLNSWLERMQDQYILGNPGLAVGDVNGDGLDDLYLCQEMGLPNCLFIHNADGTATDMSRDWGVDWLHNSRSALLIDWDNDGDQDLAVAMNEGVVLAANEERRSFRVIDMLPTPGNTMSLSAADFDEDGDLDIYGCVYQPVQVGDDSRSGVVAGIGRNLVYHDANDGGRNFLLRNEGENVFIDVTGEVGLDVNNQRWSFASSWEDFDNDGDQDLYVANDYGRDNLYRNDCSAGAGFVDVSDVARVEDAGSGMAITWGDTDRDGWMDAYISNMFSGAGNRIVYQSQFKPDADGVVKTRYQRLARGNTLLKNLGDGTFRDVSAPAAVEMGRWAWSSIFIDINNDGWEDLLVANGYITGEDTGDL